MQDDRIARYHQAAIAAREKAETAFDPKLWFEIADGWEELVAHVRMLTSPNPSWVRLPRPSDDELTHGDL
jgi:hypothetical protein